MKRRLSLVIALLVLVLTLVLPAGRDARANDLQRDRDPLVLNGSDLDDLLGLDPIRIVAFRYDGGWIQIPVQVDERAVVDFGTVYGGGLSGYTFLTYTDTSTFTGADPDTAFDLNDELVVLGKHAGDQSSAMAEPDTPPIIALRTTLT